jgi:hypothetical protein
MNVSLTPAQIAELKRKASLETDREIYSISFTITEITINNDWSTPVINRNDFHNELVSAIEHYCSRHNIEWEYNATYSAWCD